ncbi:translocation/assembly module TamB domain-containing protein [Crocosphaera sp. XPORK-15E]|uniref:translocation/assembly module TamB domain-containing protein n=1 Tax=Crocosphaera sp. XPORK-15E TaxID=3110247 RepID=UPI002B21AE17|nr:translocation/assembly module TamB domain-containing protein [Crocosphaera sp. XPORK-15E]MEA5532396.1 translocation/assembly module TamB domain-containing protein [Crocosphaera sp. XPORK-15E]
MTNTPPNPPPEPSESGTSLLGRLVNFVKKPSTLLVGGVLLSLGVAGYGGINYFVYEKLSPLLSSELSKLLEREVRVGEVESFSFNHIRIGNSAIPTQENDRDRADIKGITVNFSPLPLLIGQPLELDVTIDDPNVYIEQDKTGKWVNLPEMKGEGELNLPIDIKANIRLNNADVSVLANGLKDIVKIEATGKGGYTYKSNDDQQVSYDLGVQLLSSDIEIKGETQIKTWETEAELRINQLSLPKLVALIPNLPVTVKSGLVDSNLSISLPSLEGIEGTKGVGTFDISKIEANIKPLKVPLKLNLGIELQGKTVKFKNTKISLGDVITEVKGSVNWQEGYNIDVDLKPFIVENVLKLFPNQIPLKLAGEIQGKIRLSGEIKNPILTGTINNTKPLLIEKTQIQALKTVFQANLNQVNLKQFQIKPTAGGVITATGKIDTGILKSIKENKQINWQKMPIALGFQVQLPNQKLIEPYYKSPLNVSLGSLTAQGKIGGNLGQPKGKIEWLAPNIVTVSGQKVSGKGAILLAGENVLLQDTVLTSNSGNITLNAVGNIKRKQWQTLVTANRFSLTPFVQFTCSLISCPAAILNQKITLSNANINLSGKLDNFALNTINSRGNLTLNIDQGVIALNTNLSQGNLNTTAIVSGLILDPYLPNISIPVQVRNTKINLSGSLDQLFANSTFNLNRLNIDGNVQLTVAGNPINANLEIGNGILAAVANVGKIPLNSLIPNLPVQSSLVRSNIAVTGNLNSLIASLGNTPDISSFRGTANLQLIVEGSLVNATGRLGSDIISGVVDFSQLPLNKFIPNLPITAQLTGAEVTLSSRVKPLLSSTPDLSSALATVNLRLATAQGTINTLTRLQNNQWNTQIAASNLNSALILSQLVPNAPQIEINDLNAQATLSGSLKSIFEGGETLPIIANKIALQIDGQKLEASGNLLISNILTNPDAQINLKIAANSNFASLPLAQLISLIPVDQKFLPEELKLRGMGEFKGTLVGQNLLTAPTNPGNIQLLGDLKLLNLAFNDRIFEPKLTGKLNATIGETIALNLRGNEDIISASLQPCTRENCPAPYLPTSFELRQTSGDKPPIIATGKLRGDEFVATVKEFPLDIFKIAPGKEFGIPGFISGVVNTEIAINFFTLEGKGTITIDQPSLGFIQGNQITANILYRDNFAQLKNATLSLGQSLYAMQGSLNFKSGAIQGNLNVNQGRVEDLLIALKLSNVERLLDLLKIQPIDYTNAQNIPSQSVGNANATIAEQVNLLAVIDQQIRELARKREAGGIPTELDIRGRFDTEIALGGTLIKPTINVEFTGQNWEWHPQASYPDIIEPLGLVIVDQQVIPVNEIKIAASFVDNAITIKPAKIQIKDTILALDGKLSPQQIDLNWQINYLSLDTIGNFIKIPLDTSGALNASGNINGTLIALQLQGQFALVDAAFQGKPLNKTVEGQFSYQDERFKLLTNEQSIIYASVNIPFPPNSDNNEFDINIRLDTDALKLVNIFTREQVLLTSGEGEVIAEIKGKLDFSQGLLLSRLDAKGLVTLNETVFQSSALPQPLTVSGKIAMDDKVIDVQQLQGTFADSKLNIAGILPLFTPQNNLETPLTVVIEQGEINLEGLYRGEVDGKVIVTGVAIQPIIGGQVILANGQILIPEISNDSQGEKVATINQWVDPRARRVASNNKPVLFNPQLQNFKVSLQNLFVESLPLFRFEFGGDLLVNGSLGDFNALQPQGAINVNRGQFNFLDTRFFVERRNQNQIVFDPKQGLLNPILNIQLRTIVSDVSGTIRGFRTEGTTEIPDDSLNKVQRVDINLALNGSLAQLVPSLGKNESEVCQIHDALQPITTTATLSDEELEKVSNCLQLLAEKGTSDQQLLSNPAIKLTSSPSRSQGEIVRLLGQQFLVLAEAFQGQNTEQLIQFGIVQLALPMLFQSLVYDIETSVSDTIGSTDFRIVPFLETIYEVEDKGYVRLSYDYGFNEFRVRYEKRF